MARAPAEADHGDVVVLRDLTRRALGHASQVEHHNASAVERDQHRLRRDVGDTSPEAKGGLRLARWKPRILVRDTPAGSPPSIPSGFEPFGSVVDRMRVRAPFDVHSRPLSEGELMSKEVSVTMVESVWRDIVAHDPPGLPLDSTVRAQLRAAADHSNQVPASPIAVRTATFTPEQAELLEAWLAIVVTRPGSPLVGGAALHSVREGIRVAR